MTNGNSMHDMPIRELIADIRKQTKEMDGRDLVRALVLNTLCFRMEKQADEIDGLRRSLDNIKVRAYELGQKELHDMALKPLQEKGNGEDEA